MIKLDIRKSEKTNEEYAVFVSFPYNADIVDIIRTQLTKSWNKDTKEWEIPLSGIDELVKDLSDFKMEIIAEDISILEPKEVEIPKDFKFKTKPFEHQIEGLKYGLSHNKWLLGDEQGLGKTKEVIDVAVAKKLQNGYKHCLVICGVNGLKWNWLNEVRTHSNEKAWILGQTIKNHKQVIGSNQDKLNHLLDLLHGNQSPINDCYFIITNIESLRYRVDTGVTEIKNGKEVKVYDYPIANALSDLCRTNVISMVAFDELHKCKDVYSEQGSQLLTINAETMIGMSGTPLMNQPMDLYVVFKWLGIETHSFYSFKNHYCQMGGYGNYQIIGYKHLDELQKRLDNIMLRRLKRDVLDLPEKIHINEYVEMTGKQAQIYREVMAGIEANIDQIKASTNPLSELIRLRQATGYTGILSTKIKESAKLDRMEEIVEEAIENDKQVVIFSNWSQIIDAVYARLNGKYAISVITGDTKDELRQTNVELFQSGKAKVMLGTTGAMGTGLTLTAGTVEIFMDEPWNRANKEQAEDRCHRVGTKENVTIYTLICKDTIDERVNALVQEKGEMADLLVDGIVRDKGALVDYLLS